MKEEETKQVDTALEKTPQQLAIEALDGKKPIEKIETKIDGKPIEKKEEKPNEKKDDKTEEKPTEITSEKEENIDGLTDNDKTFFLKIKERFKDVDEFDAFVSDKPKDIDVDESLYIMQELSKKLKISDYGIIGKLTIDNIKNMSDIEVIRLKKTIEDPDYISNPKLLDRSLSKEYFKKKPEDYDMLSDEEKADIDLEVEEAEFKQKKDAKKFRSEFESMLNEISVPKKKTDEEVRKEIDAKTEKLKVAWATPILDVAKVMDKVSLSTEGKDPVTFEFDVPAGMSKQKDEIMAEIVGYLFQNDKQPSADVLKEIKAYAQKEFVARNMGYFVTKIHEKLSAEMNEKLIKLTNNPSALKSESDVAVGVEKTEQEKYMEEHFK